MPKCLPLDMLGGSALGLAIGSTVPVDPDAQVPPGAMRNRHLGYTGLDERDRARSQHRPARQDCPLVLTRLHEDGSRVLHSDDQRWQNDLGMEEADVTHWSPADEETIGKKPKQWLFEPTEDERDQRWLWKARTTNRDKAQVEYFKGDDWAELVSTKLGSAMGLPVPVVLPAVKGPDRGIISRDFTDEPDSLQQGNVLMRRHNPDHPEELVRGDPTYTLEAVLDTVVPLAPPARHGDRLSALEWFVGYLVLDAWVGNTDRHHLNWGAIETPAGRQALAPSYDHASSLGFQLDDAYRNEALARADEEVRSVEWWSDRAPSEFFDCASPLEAFEKSRSWVAPNTTDHWIRSLAQASERVPATVASVPAHRMSQPSRLFAFRLLRHNHSRIVSLGRPTMSS